MAIDGHYIVADQIEPHLRKAPIQAWLEGDALEDHNDGLKQRSIQMAHVLVVTSGKGGVGKTTSTAALGAALARGGERVVVIDFDVGLRNLDLVMGAERRVVYDLIHVIQGTAKAFPSAHSRQANRYTVPARRLPNAR